ncbi:hypothetical protein G6030_02365 [Dietzia sp. E1]|uniref:hypothetical protein n=1 Tax=Dietzia sp. E1 TaxID=328361 RepID=UPI0015F98EE9|nr:hypothetical protein [Dietzia sp. E1]MBB1020146.1 hypothetical protein [Dietzia sp. E1]
MATNQPDGKLPILKWRNALLFSGKMGPKPIVRATLVTLAARADNTTLTFFMGVDELSHIMGTGYSTAEKHLQRALESGWVEQTSRGGSFGKVSSFRLTFGATENPEGIIPPPPKRTPLPAKSEGNPREVDGSDSVSDTGQDGNPSEVRDGTPQNRGMEPLKSEGPTTNQLLQTTPKISPPPEPGIRVETPLPLDWQPNHTHDHMLERLGIDKKWAVAEFICRLGDLKRSDWNGTFGAFINAVDEGRDDVLFPYPDDYWDDELGEYRESPRDVGDTISVPAPVTESPERTPTVEDEPLPITYQRPEWLTPAQERTARALSGHPTDDELAQALMTYLSQCQSSGRAPNGDEFPMVAQKHIRG